MDRAEIIAALTALGEALHRRGVEGELRSGPQPRIFLLEPSEPFRAIG